METLETKSHQDAIKTLGDKIKGIKFTMLTTVAEDGSLRSRPMATQDVEFNGTLWFFTDTGAAKVGDLKRVRQVNLSDVKPDDKLWGSVSGTARPVHDQAVMQGPWGPTLPPWFPQGLHDPNLALIEVTVTGAEYWEGPNTVATALRTLRGAITGQQWSLGEEKRLDISSASH